MCAAIDMLSSWFQEGTGHSHNAWKTDNESVTRWFSEAKHAINRCVGVWKLKKKK